jgi:hypothetical protein
MYAVFPSHYDYYWHAPERACAKTDEIGPCDQEMPFSSYTFNVSPQSTCHMYIDGCNLAGGLCLISPYEKYDWQKGGHLILHEPKVALALPQGSFVFIPSALISHESVPIMPEEERCAFTAFSPAGLFQWVENDFRRVPSLSSWEKMKRTTRMGETESQVPKRYSHKEIIEYSRHIITHVKCSRNNTS